LNIDTVRSYLQSNQQDKIPLGNLKVLHMLVELIADSDERVRKKSSDLIFSTEFIPTKYIVEFYLKNPHPNIKQVVTKNLKYFIPILYEYLTSVSSFDLMVSIELRSPAFCFKSVDSKNDSGKLFIISKL